MLYANCLTPSDVRLLGVNVKLAIKREQSHNQPSRRRQFRAARLRDIRRFYADMEAGHFSA